MNNRQVSAKGKLMMVSVLLLIGDDGDATARIAQNIAMNTIALITTLTFNLEFHIRALGFTGFGL